MLLLMLTLIIIINVKEKKTVITRDLQDTNCSLAIGKIYLQEFFLYLLSLVVGVKGYNKKTRERV